MSKNLVSVNDYPPLRKWLDEHNAVQAWTRDIPRGGRAEAWRIGPSVALIVLHASDDGKPHGWNIYTDLDTLDIEKTLEDAKKRLGLDKE